MKSKQITIHYMDVILFGFWVNTSPYDYDILFMFFFSPVVLGDGVRGSGVRSHVQLCLSRLRRD